MLQNCTAVFPHHRCKAVMTWQSRPRETASSSSVPRLGSLQPPWWPQPPPQYHALPHCQGRYLHKRSMNTTPALVSPTDEGHPGALTCCGLAAKTRGRSASRMAGLSNQTRQMWPPACPLFRCPPAPQPSPHVGHVLVHGDVQAGQRRRLAGAALVQPPARQAQLALRPAGGHRGTADGQAGRQRGRRWGGVTRMHPASRP